MKHRCNYTRLEPIEKVIPNPRNPNTQIELRAKILDFQGWRSPIVVSKSSGFIVRGHGRLLAAQRLKLKKVPIDVQTYDNEAQEWADLVADNRIAELAEMDRATLKDLIEALDTGDLDLDLTGFDEASLEDLMSEFFVPEEGNTDEDEIPEEVEARTNPGDLWQLGDHRLLCGDSTKAEDVEKALGGGKPDLQLTDPPYGIGYAGSMKLGQKKFGWKQYEGGWDETRPSDETILFHQSLCTKSILWGGNFFPCLPVSAGWLIWNKVQRNFSMGEGELAWTNFLNSVRIIDLARGACVSDNKQHPTQKAVKVLEWCLGHAEECTTVFDPFLGSGTTLIAAQRLERICYGIEIDPHYCDVTIQRWEDFTGKKARKVKK